MIHQTKPGSPPVKSKFWRKNWVIVAGVAIAIVLVAGTTFAVALSKKNRPVASTVHKKTATPSPAPAPAKADAPSAAAKKAIKEKPPEYSSGGATESENEDGSKTVTVSDGGSSPENTSAAASAGSSGGAPNSIHYIDETGKYPNLGAQLASYISSNLLYGNEVPALHAIIVENAGNTGWAGLYSGTYTIDGSGHISSAWGYITLNTYYYESSPYFVDYEKLVLSHEYGHHYTLYHKWIDWQSPFGDRFPSSYYSVRPLATASTAPDYSRGWSNCDAEIIAEDYSYLYSGYGAHAMAGSYGYPSAGTKTWLISEPSGPGAQPAPTAAPATATPAPASTATAAPTQTATATPGATTTVTATATPAPADSENPSVTITNPADNPHAWPSGNLPVSASATDNVAVQKIEFYIDDYLAATQNSSTISRTWLAQGTPVGSYTLKAKAYDTAGNTAETSITVNKSF